MLFAKKDSQPLPITFQLTFIILMLILIILISSYIFLFQATSVFYIRRVNKEISDIIKEHFLKPATSQGQIGQLKRSFLNINAIVVLNDEILTNPSELENINEVIESAREYGIDKKSIILRVENESFLVLTNEVNNDSFLVIKPMIEFDGFLALLKNMIFIISLVTIGVSIFLSMIISHYISRPIKSIARDIQNISVSNLSKRIKVNESNQEFSILSRSVNDTLEKIERGYIRQKQFSSDVAHEIRTPLTSITGFAKLIKRWGAEDPKVAQEAAEDIYNAGNNLIKLTENLMFLAQPDTEINFKEENIEDLINDVLTHFSREEIDRIVLKVPDVKVIIDEKLFKILIKTLVENALKYGDKKEVLIQLKNGNLNVIDNGKGVPESEKDKIFNRFFQSDSSRSSKGFGLGLSIAKKVSDSLKLRIEVLDNPNGGACFSVQGLKVVQNS